MKRICHLTSVHPVRDPRILLKECSSLSVKYEVHLVAVSEVPVTYGNVIIHTVPPAKNHIARWIFTVGQVYRKAKAVKAAVYHFHDPELIPAAFLLRVQGARVVYDVHEDNYTTILQRDYIPGFIKKPAAAILARAEQFMSTFYHVVLAERYYKRRFPHGRIIQNFPMQNIIIRGERTFPYTKPAVLYTGSLTRDRGALEYLRLANSMKHVQFHFIGRCKSSLAEHMLCNARHNNIHMEKTGEYVSFSAIQQCLHMNRWLAGMAIFPQTRHYEQKELTKFYEYMAAGLPVIYSRFPVWEQLIGGHSAGIAVDPGSVDSMVNAVQYLLENPGAAEGMGSHGKNAVIAHYTWEHEAEKLFSLYEGLFR